MISQIVSKVGRSLAIRQEIGLISFKQFSYAPLSEHQSHSVRYASNDIQKAPQAEDKPLKFTQSDAYLNYRATSNFYGGDDRDLPRSHNLVLASTGIFGFYYLIFLRDDVEDGGKNLFKPIHETIPELAIPLLQAAIVENKRFGADTSKLEKKLAEYMKEPEKYGGGKPKLVEN